MENSFRYGERPIEFQLEAEGEYYYLASEVSGSVRNGRVFYANDIKIDSYNYSKNSKKDPQMFRLR